MSPPCVAYFEGNNFGATYQGVTRDEVRILVYFDGSSNRNANRPSPGFYDLDQPATAEEHFFASRLRDLQNYFHDRYQTYNRRLHFYLHLTDTSAGTSAETRQAHASEYFERVKPFVVVNEAGNNQEAYAETMAAKGSMVFGGSYGRPASLFSRYPRLLWSYLPSLEQQVEQFSSYVCTQAVPFPTSFSGEPNGNGKKRTFGLLTSPNNPPSRAFMKLLKEDISSCGATISGEADADQPGQSTAQAMAQFKGNEVTTILQPYPGGPWAASAASSIAYYPEWLTVGYGPWEHYQQWPNKDPAQFDRTWVLTFLTLYPPFSEELCHKAIREVNPGVSRRDAFAMCIRWFPFYQDLRHLVTGIQIAGPRLNPDNIYRGFLAVPPVASSDPSVPACFSQPNDYTCIKDAAPMWWDSSGKAPDSQNAGCWRMPQAGKRYVAGDWPKVNIDHYKKPQDVCNNWGIPYSDVFVQ